MTTEPDFLVYHKFRNEEDGEIWDVHVNAVGELSLTPHDPERMIVFAAEEVLVLLSYLDERRKIITRYAEQNWESSAE
jgi:hypothetical protein